MPCMRFRVDNKAPLHNILQDIVELRTGSNAVSASQANSFYSLRLGQLWYLMRLLIMSWTAVAPCSSFSFCGDPTIAPSFNDRANGPSTPDGEKARETLFTPAFRN